MWTQRKLFRSFKAAEKFIPENLKLNSQYQSYLEFLKNYEFGLALDSLLELIEETEYEVENEYWEILRQVAEAMQLNETIQAISTRIK